MFDKYNKKRQKKKKNDAWKIEVQRKEVRESLHI